MKINNPSPAPYLMRIFAFILDWILGFLLFILLAKQIVAAYHAEGWKLLTTWTENFIGEYEKIQNSALSAAEMTTRVQQLAGTAENLPAPVTEMLNSLLLSQLLFFTIYFFAQDFFLSGGSPGKRIMNLRVVSLTDGSPPALGNALLRGAMKTFFFGTGHLLAMILGALNAIMPLLNATRLSWHDRLSRTVVIDIRTSGSTANDDDVNKHVKELNK